MIVKLVFDILNTENRSFEYKGDLSNEEYARRLQDYVYTTGRDVENMLYYGVTNTNNKSLYESTKDIQLETIDKECDALLLDINNNVIDETNLIEHVNDGKMFIIKIKYWQIFFFQRNSIFINLLLTNIDYFLNFIPKFHILNIISNLILQFVIY